MKTERNLPKFSLMVQFLERDMVTQTAMPKTSCMSAATRLAMKRFGSDGTDLVRCSLLRPS